MHKIKEKATRAVSRLSALRGVGRLRKALTGDRGSGYVDYTVIIIISIVLGILILAALYVLFNTSLLPSISSKLQDMFNYGG